MSPSFQYHRRSHRVRSERGETLVEFAFASVIFFMMVFGTIEFGLAIWNYNLVSDLAQEGARFASVHGRNSDSPADQATVAAFVESRSSALLTGLTITTPGGSPDTLRAGAVVQVRVDYQLVAGGGLIPSWNIPIFSTARMTVAR